MKNLEYKTVNGIVKSLDLIYEECGFGDVEPYNSKIGENIVFDFKYEPVASIIKFRITSLQKRGYNPHQINTVLKELEDKDIEFILEGLSLIK